MRTRVHLAIACLLLSGASAFAQVSLRPDPTPRVPPQAGQGLDIEDEAFLQRATTLSRAEIDAAKLAAEKASDPALKELSGQIAAKHEDLSRRLQEQAAQAKENEVTPEAGNRWDADVQRLRGLEGEAFDREYLNWQLRVHLGLASLYQTQASHTPESDLAKFAIIAFNEIQQQFTVLKSIGSRFGLSVDTVGQPPQY